MFETAIELGTLCCLSNCGREHQSDIVYFDISIVNTKWRGYSNQPDWARWSGSLIVRYCTSTT